MIKEVGLTGDFLSTEHTARYFRRELSRSDLVVRTRRAVWESQGGKSLEEMAQEEVRRILDVEPRVYLDAAQEKELQRIERSGLAELGLI